MSESGDYENAILTLFEYGHDMDNLAMCCHDAGKSPTKESSREWVEKMIRDAINKRISKKRNGK